MTPGFFGSLTGAEVCQGSHSFDPDTFLSMIGKGGRSFRVTATQIILWQEHETAERARKRRDGGMIGASWQSQPIIGKSQGA
jgi:hypothetical protein